MTRYYAKRDKEKYRQIIVPFPVGSEVLQFYTEEAKRMGVGLPTLIYMLLADRYEALHGDGKNIWFPRGVPVRQELEQASEEKHDDNPFSQHAEITVDPSIALKELGDM